jgi:hypothetical protein
MLGFKKINANANYIIYIGLSCITIQDKVFTSAISCMIACIFPYQWSKGKGHEVECY